MLAPSDIKWFVEVFAHGECARLRQVWGDQRYFAQVEALKLQLCAYFQNDECSSRQGSTICPIDGAPAGGKAFKVRCGTPGGGKSGGLRLACVVFCERRHVHIAYVEERANDPDLADMVAAAAAVKSQP